MVKSLAIKNVKVLFVHFNDPKFGSSITVDVTDPEVLKSIEDFYATNNINGGKAKIKEYEGTKQATFKLAKFLSLMPADSTEVIEGLDEIAKVYLNKKLAHGAEVSFMLKTYDYSNTFGTGTTTTVTAMAIKKPAEIKTALEQLQ